MSQDESSPVGVTLRFTIGVRLASDAEVQTVVARDNNISLAEIRDGLCGENNLDPTTHFLFQDGQCVDHTQPAVSLDEGSGILQLAQGCIRVRSVGNSVPDRLLMVDLQASRPTQSLIDEVRDIMGFYETPTTLLCKDTEVDPELMPTLGDSNVRLNDIVLIVRNNPTISLNNPDAEEAEPDRTYRFNFYGLQLSLMVPATTTIQEIKELAAKEIHSAAEPKYGAVFATELRVVQCNINYDNSACVGELKPVVAELLRQWGPEHLFSEQHFVGGGSLCVNCRFCASAGAVARLRPRCHQCLRENVVLDSTLRRWNDLVDSKAHCFTCNVTTPLFWGFFCTGTCHDGRCTTHRKREMIAVFDSGKHTQDDLLRALNGGCFSYACAGGRVDASAVDKYVPIAIDASQLSSIPPGLNLSDTVHFTVPTEPEEPEEKNGVPNETEGSTTVTEQTPSTEEASAPKDLSSAEPPSSTEQLPSPVAQLTAEANGWHLPDTFFTVDGERAYQWFGVQNGFEVHKAEDAPEGTRLLPNYLSELNTRYVVLQAQLEDGAGAGGASDNWVMRALKKTYSVGGLKWSPMFGFGDSRNVNVVSKKLSVVIQPLRRTLTTTPYLRLGLDALREERVVDEFCNGFTAVDDLYVPSTPNAKEEPVAEAEAEAEAKTETQAETPSV